MCTVKIQMKSFYFYSLIKYPTLSQITHNISVRKNKKLFPIFI